MRFRIFLESKKFAGFLHSGPILTLLSNPSNQAQETEADSMAAVMFYRSGIRTQSLTNFLKKENKSLAIFPVFFNSNFNQKAHSFSQSTSATSAFKAGADIKIMK